tara:strand:+ start:2168 stop:2941 length:774 start_codon:yes stop_codon:yes gene_type:complete
MNLKSRLLRLIYNGMLTGMPTIMNNPYNKNTLYAPFNVLENSIYINYKLDNEQYNMINNYLDNKKSNLKPVKTSILIEDNKNYFISVNIYKCTSPLFKVLTSDSIIRCEINTYIIDNENNIGTLILDYSSSHTSFDSYNLIKKPDKYIELIKNNTTISGYVNNQNIDLYFSVDLNNKLYNDRLSSDLVKFTDRIYYLDGIYDKLFYDTSLLNNPIIFTQDNDIEFSFNGCVFNQPESVFVFNKPINFVGGMWKNLFY